METSLTQSALASLPTAFAAACRHSRTDGELFQYCREALTQRFQTDEIWFSVKTPSGFTPVAPPPSWLPNAVEVARMKSGETEVVVSAGKSAAKHLQGMAMPLALGLAVMVELHGVLQERQSALEDATFQLRALRQVARLLSSVHSTEETEHLILDFMTEVFFAWWACLYRPVNGQYIPKVFRSLKGATPLQPIEREALDKALPPGAPSADTSDVALAALLPASTELLISLEAGAERLAVMALGPRLHDRQYGPPEHELAGTLAFAAAIALKNAQLVEQLHSAATTDELTGLFNRRAMEERLEAETAGALRHQLRTSVVLFDIDRFKLVNDSLGHPAGDRMLVLIADLLRAQCRTLDAVGRFGGDEFLVILPMTSPEEAMAFVTRLQQRVASIEQSHPEFGRPTLSLGIAETPKHGSTVSGILAAADAALYRAKRSGRDSIAFADDP